MADTDGGGLYAKSTATLTNVTVAEDFAERGGGLFAESMLSVNIRNTIIALNLNSDGTSPDVFGLINA